MCSFLFFVSVMSLCIRPFFKQARGDESGRLTLLGTKESETQYYAIKVLIVDLSQPNKNNGTTSFCMTRLFAEGTCTRTHMRPHHE